MIYADNILLELNIRTSFTKGAYHLAKRSEDPKHEPRVKLINSGFSGKDPTIPVIRGDKNDVRFKDVKRLKHYNIDRSVDKDMIIFATGLAVYARLEIIDYYENGDKYKHPSEQNLINKIEEYKAKISLIGFNKSNVEMIANSEWERRNLL